MRISFRFAPERLSLRRQADRAFGGILADSCGFSLRVCRRPVTVERLSFGRGGVQASRDTFSFRLFSKGAPMVEAGARLCGVVGEYPRKERLAVLSTSSRELLTGC